MNEEVPLSYSTRTVQSSTLEYATSEELHLIYDSSSYISIRRDQTWPRREESSRDDICFERKEEYTSLSKRIKQEELTSAGRVFSDTNPLMLIDSIVSVVSSTECRPTLRIVRMCWKQLILNWPVVQALVSPEHSGCSRTLTWGLTWRRTPARLTQYTQW